MTRSHVSKIALNAASCLPLMWCAAASAQSAPAQEASPAATEADAPGDIIVTAQRRSENLQSVPVSVTAITADSLRNRDLNNLQQITLAAPSLQIGQDNTFAIRGVGTLAFQQTVDPAVAISLDEVSLARNSLSENVFNDVAQVEVLNGPQGLLFGKNASGGLLNLTTVMPKLGKIEGNLEAEYNLRDTTPDHGQGGIARANLNLPISTNSALRLNALYEYQQPITAGKSTGARDEADKKSFDLRAKYLWEATPDLTLYAIANYAESHGTAGLYDRTYRSLGSGSVNAASLAADGFTAGPNLLRYRTDGSNYRDLTNYGAQVKATYTLSNDWQIIDIVAYKGYKNSSSFDQDFTSGDSASLSASRNKFHQFSNELRVALPAGDRLSGQVGLYYLTFQERANNLTGGAFYFPSSFLSGAPFCIGASAAPPGCPVRNDYVIGSDSSYVFQSKGYAAFGQLTYALTDTLHAIGGARVTRDRVSINLNQNQLNYLVPFGGPRGTFTGNASNTNFSYKLGTQFQPTRDVMLYGTYATGYKGPGMNNSAAATSSTLAVAPETSRNIEVGVKTNWLNRRVTINLSAFRTKYVNYQASAFDAVAVAYTVRNAASLVSKGAELSVIARPVRGLTINGAATFLSAEFKDFPGAQCYTGQPGCGANGTFNAAGLSTPLAAKFTSSLSATYEVPIRDGLGLLFGGDLYHRSSINYAVAPNPQTAVGPLNVLGGRVSLNIGETLQLSVFCKNCTDQRTPNFLYQDPGDAASGVNSVVQTFGFNSARTIGASARYSF